jgi:hypothetical protein
VTVTTDSDFAAGVHLKLTDEEKKFLDEPYAPREIVRPRADIFGLTNRSQATLKLDKLDIHSHAVAVAE